MILTNVVAKRDIFFKGENSTQPKILLRSTRKILFYEIQLRRGDKISATLFPRIQLNPSHGWHPALS